MQEVCSTQQYENGLHVFLACHACGVAPPNEPPQLPKNVRQL